MKPRARWVDEMFFGTSDGLGWFWEHVFRTERVGGILSGFVEPRVRARCYGRYRWRMRNRQQQQMANSLLGKGPLSDITITEQFILRRRDLFKAFKRATGNFLDLPRSVRPNKHLVVEVILRIQEPFVDEFTHWTNQCGML